MPCRVIEYATYPHEDMDSWDICPEIIPGIGHHMDDREEEEEHIRICISKEENNESTQKCDRKTRNDKYPKLAIFLDPEWGYTEEIPDRESDQWWRHEVFMARYDRLSLSWEFTNIEGMIGLTIHPTEYDTREFSEKSDTREDMCLNLVISRDRFHDPIYDEFTSYEEIHGNREDKEYTENNHKIQKESTCTRKYRTQYDHESDTRPDHSPTDDERVWIFPRYVDPEEGNHARDDSDFIILILDRDGTRPTLEYISDMQSTHILCIFPMIGSVGSLEEEDDRPSWDDGEDDRMYLYPEDREIEKNTYQENIYSIDTGSNTHDDARPDRVSADEWISEWSSRLCQEKEWSEEEIADHRIDAGLFIHGSYLNCLQYNRRGRKLQKNTRIVIISIQWQYLIELQSFFLFQYHF